MFHIWKGVKVVLRGLQITVTGPTTHHVYRDVAAIGGAANKGVAQRIKRAFFNASPPCDPNKVVAPPTAALRQHEPFIVTAAMRDAITALLRGLSQRDHPLPLALKNKTLFGVMHQTTLGKV